MGKSIKTAQNGTAQAHAAGTPVYLSQHLVHDPIGTLAYEWNSHVDQHAQMADAAYQRLSELQPRLLELEPLSGKVRHVPRELASEAYEYGSTMVSNVVRTIRHFAALIGWETGKRPTYGRALDELRSAAELIGLDLRVRSPGYHALCEMVDIRDAIEHPKPDNLYRGNDTDWDRVPLAWILSDRSCKAYAAYDAWLTSIFEDFSAWLEQDKAKRPQGTWTVKRGMGSAYPMKKPPVIRDHPKPTRKR